MQGRDELAAFFFATRVRHAGCSSLAPLEFPLRGETDMDNAFQWVMGFGAVAIGLFILASLFWIWMLVDCLANPRLPGVEKVVWFCVIFFLHLLGAVLYYLAG